MSVLVYNVNPSEESKNFQNNQLSYYEQMSKTSLFIIHRFNRQIKFYVLFNLLFIFAGILEVFLLLLFFTYFSQSSLLAFALSLLFLTFFSYFIFRMYFENSKTEQFQDLKDKYVNNLKLTLDYQEGVAEHHISLASSCSKLSDQLAGKELSYYLPPRWLNFLSPIIEEFSHWWHWQDVLYMRELFLEASIFEHIKLVRNEPINLEFHAVLANSYVLLSSLYALQRKQLLRRKDWWLYFKNYSIALELKFRETAQKAVEELKILNEFAPNDPWVHLQLAYSYHDLAMSAEEINEYEIILKLNPHDFEVLYKLGMLYFQEGMNAKGLKIYEVLKCKHYKKAESLLKLYGA
jgi:tetratricopeptide (TPR) repeat protein